MFAEGHLLPHSLGAVLLFPVQCFPFFHHTSSLAPCIWSSYTSYALGGSLPPLRCAWKLTEVMKSPSWQHKTPWNSPGHIPQPSQPKPNNPQPFCTPLASTAKKSWDFQVDLSYQTQAIFSLFVPQLCQVLVWLEWERYSKNCFCLFIFRCAYHKN